MHIKNTIVRGVPKISSRSIGSTSSASTPSGDAFSQIDWKLGSDFRPWCFVGEKTVGFGLYISPGMIAGLAKILAYLVWQVTRTSLSNSEFCLVWAPRCHRRYAFGPSLPASQTDCRVQRKRAENTGETSSRATRASARSARAADNDSKVWVE